MRETKYVPSQADGKDAEFEGHVVIDELAVDEKFEVMDEAGFTLKDDGTMDMNPMKSLPKLVRLLKPKIKKVALKRKDDETEYKDVDALRYDSRCTDLLFDVINRLISGRQVSKK